MGTRAAPRECLTQAGSRVNSKLLRVCELKALIVGENAHF